MKAYKTRTQTIYFCFFQILLQFFFLVLCLLQQLNIRYNFHKFILHCFVVFHFMTQFFGIFNEVLLFLLYLKINFTPANQNSSISLLHPQNFKLSSYDSSLIPRNLYGFFVRTFSLRTSESSVLLYDCSQSGQHFLTLTSSSHCSYKNLQPSIRPESCCDFLRSVLISSKRVFTSFSCVTTCKILV